MKIKNILLLFILNLVISGCDKESNHTNEYDLGTGEFEEPFIGPLSSQPELLRKSLNYFPFNSSLLRSDTLHFCQEIEAIFNEECIRSSSSVELHITDLKNRPLKGVDIYCNGLLTDRGVIKLHADSLKKNILLTYKIYPYLGDTILRSKVVLLPYELDKINGQNVIKETQDFILCRAEQKLSYPIFLWLLWLVACFLVLGLILFILYILFLILSAIVSYIQLFSISLAGIRFFKIRFKNRRERSRHLIDKEEKKDITKKKEEKKDERHNAFFKPWKGRKYKKGLKGKRILVVGASHYCKHFDDCKYFSDCTNEQLMNSYPWNKKCKFIDEDGATLSDTTRLEIEGFLRGNQIRTYQNFTNFMINNLGLCNTKGELWNSIVFYNYVQFFLPHENTLKKNVSEKDWDAFSKVVKDVDPDLIILWGVPLGEFMKSKSTKAILNPQINSDYAFILRIEGKDRIVIYSYHPSSSDFNSDRQNLAKQIMNLFYRK